MVSLSHMGDQDIMALPEVRSMHTIGDYCEIMNAILKILIIIVMHVRGLNKLELKSTPTLNKYYIEKP